MPSRFLNNISINDEYSFPATDGSADQIIQTDGSGNLTFVDPSVLSVGESEQVHIACKNTSGVAISKGDPVYITGTVGTSFKIEIAAADASNSAKMPAVGLAETDLGINAEGFVIVSGVLKNLTTDPLSTSDGTPSSNDTVYVKAGGGLTRTKPTGSGNLIQNVGKVGRVNSANAGSLAVSTIMRTNDVPNLTTGKIWVGSPTYTTESTVVHLDETNGRMGIGTTSPNATLDVNGAGNFSGGTVVSGIDTQTVGVAVAKGTYIKSNDGNYLRNIIGHTSSGNIEIGQAGTSLIGDILLRPGSAGNIRFFGTGSEDMRITSSGNVGIGTTSPGQKLTIDQGVGNVNQGIPATSGSTQNGILRLQPGGPYGESFDFGMNVSTTYAWIQPTNKGNHSVNYNLSLNPNGGNVGIGTTSPSQKLDVEGNIYTSGNIRIKDTGDQLEFTNANVALQRSGNFLELGGYDGIIFSSSNATLDNQSERMRITSTGNVGIGTTSPDSILHVKNGDAGVTPYSLGTGLNIEGTTSTVGINIISSDTAQGRIYFASPSSNTAGAIEYNHNASLSSGFMKFRTGNSERMRITGDGNVGIGTPSPAQKLHVDGNIRVGDTNDVIYADKFFTVSNANLHIGANNGYDTVFFNGPADERMRITSSGNIGIGTTNPDYKLEVDGTLGVSRTDGIIFAGSTGTGTGSKIVSNTSNDLIFSTALATSPYTTTERVRILNNGNVGIGTDSPNALLEIKSTTIPSVRLNSTDTSFPTFGTIDAYNNTTYRGGLTWASNPVQNGARITYIGFPGGTQTTGTFEVGSNFVDTSIGNGSMVTRLTTTGLGIGTTSPSYTLDVNGVIRGEQYLRLADIGGTNRFSIRAESTYGTIDNGSNTLNYNANNHLFLVGLSEKMRINSAGNVGIGTTSPSPIGTNITTLDIQGSSGGGFRFGTTAGVEGGLWCLGSGTTLGSISSIPLYFRTGNQNRAVILANGNFGIGTTSPGAKLDISNTGGSAGSLADCQTYSALTVKPYSSVDSKLTFSANGVSTQLIQATNNAGTTGRQISLQPFSGNVGIGVTLPSEKLDVNGSIKASASTDAYKGYIKSVITTGYSMKSASTAYQYIPYNSYTLTTLQAYYNRTVAAYNGRVKKIIVKRIDGASADATGMKFKKEINGTVIATEYTATVLSGSGNFQATYNFANSDFTFSAGDSIGVLMQSSGGTGMIGAGAIQIVLEYNIT